MSLSNAPAGLTSFGAVVLPTPGLVPAPTNNSAGTYFLDGTNGNDGYAGTDPLHPFKTLDRAYNACLGGCNEIIYVLGNTNGINFSSAIASAGSGLVWAKSFTHLVGLCAPVAIGQRARITGGPSTNFFTPLISVTGSGNLFQNLEFFNGGAHATEAAVCVAVSGSRNAFINCQISGGGNTTNSTNAAMRSLTITGPGGENYFQHCYIGLDTVLRNTTSTEIELLSGTVRNVFEDCTIASYSSASTTLLVKIGVDGIDRAVYFRNCIFHNPSTFSSGSALASAVSINASGGVAYFHNCLSGGTACFTAFQGTPAANTFGDNPGSAAAVKGVAMTS